MEKQPNTRAHFVNEIIPKLHSNQRNTLTLNSQSLRPHPLEYYVEIHAGGENSSEWHWSIDIHARPMILGVYVCISGVESIYVRYEYPFGHKIV